MPITLSIEIHMAIIKIDNTEYDVDALPDMAKQQLQNLQFVENELTRISSNAAVLQTARTVYLKALQESLINAPTLAGEDTIKLG